MDKFLIGSATSSHQVDGNNIYSDYWAMENLAHTEFFDKSGIACDHYNLYKEDIDLMAKYKLNAYRFSIEWARIEPVKYQYNEIELKHYIDVIDYCIKNNIEPIITLHHFSSPKWLIDEGGWENPKVIEYFKNYTNYVVSAIKDKVKYICTINEANMGIQVKQIADRYKKQILEKLKNKNKDNFDSSVQVGINFSEMLKNMKIKAKETKEVFGSKTIHPFVSIRSKKSDMIVIKAHIEARKEIKEINKDINVGITLSLHDIQAIDNGDRKAQKIWNEEFYHYIPYLKDDNFIGVQNYTRSLISKKGLVNNPKDSKTTEMGYEYYPKALSNVVNRVYEELNLPILVSENGIATSNDKDRCSFIDEALNGLNESINKGVKVIGYMYWSFLDNFEWQKGYTMHFGLVSVDRTTLKRTPKESLSVLSNYIDKFNK